MNLPIFLNKSFAQAIAACCLSAGLTIIAGCTQYQPKPLHPAKTAARFEQRSLRNAAVVKYARSLQLPLPARFPSVYNLNALTAAAWFYNPQLRLAATQVAEAKAAIVTAGARPNPSVGFSPTYAAKSPAGVNPWILGFNFNIPIEWPGKRSARVAAARQNVVAAQWAMGRAAWSIRSQVFTALVKLHFARRRTRLLQRSNAAASENLRLIANMVRAGQLSRVQLGSAQLLQQQTQLALISQTGQAAHYKNTLAMAIGVPVKALAKVAIKLGGATSPNAGALRRVGRLGARMLVRLALQNRLDLREALARYAAAEQELKLQVLRQYPNINIGPGYKFDQGENKFTLGFSMTLPLFNQNQGPIAQAEARRAAAARTFDSVQMRCIEQTHSALVTYQQALRQLRQVAHLADSAKQQLSAARRMVAAGNAGRLTLVNARLIYDNLIAERATIRQQAWLALANLEDAVESPLPAPAQKLATAAAGATLEVMR